MRVQTIVIELKTEKDRAIKLCEYLSKWFTFSDWECHFGDGYFPVQITGTELTDSEEYDFQTYEDDVEIKIEEFVAGHEIEDWVVYTKYEEEE